MAGSLPDQHRSPSFAALGIVAGAVVCVALAWFYVAAATEHGKRVNLSKARGDQSGYLWDAENVYANWHGREPPTIIGERNRMPVYAGYLALFYYPGLSDAEFFEVGKRANIYLSLGLILLLGVVLARELPLHAAVNLTLVVMFGYFIFKAGYTQSEPLFYFLLFVTFLGCWHLFRARGGWRTVSLAALVGAIAGVAHLTKAAMPLFVAIFLLLFALEPAVGLLSSARKDRTNRLREAIWRWAAAVAFASALLAVLSPYLATNKRTFGRYSYNVNTTFYAWCDDWAQASGLTYSHGDGVGWPTLPLSELPSPARYWREHTVGQIAARVVSGFENMAIVSYTTYDVLIYLILYAGMLSVLAVTRGHVIARMIRSHTWLAAFVALYGCTYLLATAFYFPVSGTGTARFFLAHLLPFFFVLSQVFERARVVSPGWTPMGIALSLKHFQLAVTVTLALDVVFRTWPRLMTTYGGF